MWSIEFLAWASGCQDRTKVPGAAHTPGRRRAPPYRFRVLFTRTRGEGAKAEVLFRHEVSLELEAKSGTVYLVEAVYGGDDPARCTATVREAVVAPAPSP